MYVCIMLADNVFESVRVYSWMTSDVCMYVYVCVLVFMFMQMRECVYLNNEKTLASCKHCTAGLRYNAESQRTFNVAYA